MPHPDHPGAERHGWQKETVTEDASIQPTDDECGDPIRQPPPSNAPSSYEVAEAVSAEPQSNGAPNIQINPKRSDVA